MFCKKCGHIIFGEEKYCEKCGYPVERNISQNTIYNVRKYTYEKDEYDDEYEDDNKSGKSKLGRFIIIVLGIAIALIIANIIKGINESNMNQKVDYYTNQASQQNDIEPLTDYATICAKDVKNNKIMSFLGNDEQISEIRYVKKSNGENMILIAVKNKNGEQTIYAYINTMYYGSDITADVDERYYTKSDEQELVKKAREIRQAWNNSTSLNTNKILENLN